MELWMAHLVFMVEYYQYFLNNLVVKSDFHLIANGLDSGKK